MDVSELKEEAQRLFSRRRYAQCAKVYQRLTELDPQDARLHVRRAEASARAGLPQRAAAAYRSAAAVLTRQGHVARARAALKLALDLEPTHAASRQALEALMHVKALAPDQAPAQGAQSDTVPGLELELELTEEDVSYEGPLEVRRLSPSAVAVRPGARGLWLLLQAHGPLQTRYLALPDAGPADTSAGAPLAEELTSEDDFEALYPAAGRSPGAAPAVIALP